MNILLYGLSLFFLAFGIHLIIWKVHLPHHQSKALLLIFMGTFFLGVIITPLLPQDGLWGCFVARGFYEVVHAFLLVLSLTMAYIITYSALEADSPSLVIIRMIAEAMPGGLAKKDLENRLTDDILIRPRINDLLRDNLVIAQGEKLRLTPQGRSFIKIFVIFRALLKSGKGG
ncbi:MAG: hypothetical protein WBV23_11910 [Desulfobaccales bacterium]